MGITWRQRGEKVRREKDTEENLVGGGQRRCCVLEIWESEVGGSERKLKFYGLELCNQQIAWSMVMTNVPLHSFWCTNHVLLSLFTHIQLRSDDLRDTSLWTNFHIHGTENSYYPLRWFWRSLVSWISGFKDWRIREVNLNTKTMIDQPRWLTKQSKNAQGSLSPVHRSWIKRKIN